MVHQAGESGGGEYPKFRASWQGCGRARKLQMALHDSFATSGPRKPFLMELSALPVPGPTQATQLDQQFCPRRFYHGTQRVLVCAIAGRHVADRRERAP
jgi:hypothetical protein